MVRFSYRMVPEVYQVFWAGMAAGEFINDAAKAVQERCRTMGCRTEAAEGDPPVRPVSAGRCIRAGPAASPCDCCRLTGG